MHDLLVRFNNGPCRLDIPREEIAALITDPQTTIWLDIYEPDEHDLALLRDDFKFHPLAIEDALHDTQRPKIDMYEGYYLVVFYAAHIDHQQNTVVTQELDIFVGKNYIVTVHDTRIPQVKETIERWRQPDSPLERSVGALLYALLDTIVDDYFPLIDNAAERIEALEDQIFTHFDDDAIQSIFQLKKELLNLRRVVSPERDVLNVLLRRAMPIFRPEDLVYLQDLYDHIIRVTDTLDTYRDLLSSALDSFLSLQSNRLNVIVKVLTIASIILMTNALIAGIYGMNFDFMPELHWPFGYPFALLLMLVVSLGLVWFFRKRKWI